MGLIRFDQDLDKITERELVYDIVERLKLGKDLYEGNALIYKAGTFLTECLKRCVLNLPASLVARFADIKIDVMQINPGASTGYCTFTDLKEGKVLLAYSEQTQMDIKETLTIHNAGSTMTCIMDADSAYIHGDHIKIYAV